MSKILIVSNRLPLNVVKNHNRLHYKFSAGGLATGVNSVFESGEKNVWIGWPGIPLENISERNRQEISDRLTAKKFYPVFLTNQQVNRYYNGFSNETIWPLFHYFPQHTIYNTDFWEAYREVNEVFCQAVLENYEPGDVVWVHDYHLLLLPGLLREKIPQASIGFFLHIPFPSFELFRFLPWRQEILQGILGSDLIGFHTYDYVCHFCNSIRRLLGYDHTFGRVLVNNRLVKVDSFAMGIDYLRFTQAMCEPEVKAEMKKIYNKVGEQKIILSIDRLDYSKGIPQRLEAYDLFLESNPEYRERVVLIMAAVPSRIKIEHYILLKKNVDELVGRINGKYGTMRWMPVWYIYRFLPFSTLVALYGAADACLVTPLRDGMNLIAKEYVAACKDGRGVLILSETAGAAQELGEALIVNPNSKEEVKGALEEALAMPEEKQAERNREMQKRLERYDVIQWATTFHHSLSAIKSKQHELQAKFLSLEIEHKLVQDYRQSERALFLLDYDGTLVPFSKKLEDARPDEEVLNLLQALSQKQENEVVIISGRDRKTMDEWLGSLSLSLSAEHGMWLKDRNKDWEMSEPMDDSWKQEIRPILELYVARTPGSFIEEKEFSLVWHYRKADSDLARARLGELKDELFHLVGNYDLAILEGSKVLEIKNARINKGRAAQNWMSEEYDFVLALGDDKTDEELFAVLPEWAYTVKVGREPSRARFNIDSFKEARSLLKKMVG